MLLKMLLCPYDRRADCEKRWISLACCNVKSVVAKTKGRGAELDFEADGLVSTGCQGLVVREGRRSALPLLTFPLQQIPFAGILYAFTVSEPGYGLVTPA
jgi:hypothetical protein